MSIWSEVGKDWMNALDKMHGSNTQSKPPVIPSIEEQKKFHGMTTQSVGMSSPSKELPTIELPKEIPKKQVIEEKVVTKKMNMEPAIYPNQYPPAMRIEFNDISQNYGIITGLIRKSLESSFHAEYALGGCSAILFQLNKAVMYSANAGRIYHEVRTSALDEMNNIIEADFPYCNLVCRPGSIILKKYEELMKMMIDIIVPSYVGFQIKDIFTLEAQIPKSNNEITLPESNPVISFAPIKQIPQWEKRFRFNTAQELNTELILGCTEALLIATKDMKAQESTTTDEDAIHRSTMMINVKSQSVSSNCIFSTENGVKKIEKILKDFPNIAISNTIAILPKDREGEVYCAITDINNKYGNTITVCIDNICIIPGMPNEILEKKYICNISAYCNKNLLDRIF